MKLTRKAARRRPRRRSSSTALVRVKRDAGAAVTAKVVEPEKTQALARPTIKSPQSNPVLVYMARLGTDRSRRSMFGGLKLILRALDIVQDPDQDAVVAFPWHMLSYEQLELVRNRLAEKSAPSTANHALSAVRGVLKVAWKMHLIDTDTYHRCASVEGIRGSRVAAGRHVTVTEIEAMFEACEDGTAIGARNACVIGLLYGCGLRRSELAEARIENLELDQRSLRVMGKGNKERVVFMPVGTYRAVRNWVNRWRGEFPGPLLYRIRRDNNITKKPLTDESIRWVVIQVIQKAELKTASPHDLRRSWIGELLDRGADISTVQQLAGHASPVTTARYDRRGESTKRAAVLLLDVPFSKRKRD